MSGRAEKQPLHQGTKEVSLRFPDGSMNNEAKTDGVFDGNDLRNEPFSYLTRKDQYEPPIPEPSQRELQEAKDKGLDQRTNLPVQPEWLSVLKKRQPPYFWFRWLFCNCFCNPQWTITRAQWIWFTNVVFLILNVWFARLYIMELSEKVDGAMDVTVFEIHTAADKASPENYAFTFKDNLKPVRIDWAVALLFLVQGFFNALAVVVGPFDRWIWVYWRQIDLCFHWWRYVEQAITYPLIGLIVCLHVQLREQNALAAVWMLFFSTVACNFLTELWSRPHRNPDRSYDMSRWLGDDTAVKPAVSWDRCTADEMTARMVQYSRRRLNYVLRTAPTTISIFPFVAAWVIIFNHYFVSLEQTRLHPDDNLYLRQPEFIPMLVFGTLLYMVVYFLPMIWWQWVPPMHYWKTEIVYCALSFVTKIFLSTLFYDNVLLKDSFSSAMALDQDLNVTTVAASGNSTGP
jgi:hypothetical protein